MTTRRTSAKASAADAMVKKMFDGIAEQGAPDHLVELADELEFAQKNGRLKRSGHAA